MVSILDTHDFVENSQLQFEPFRSGRDGQVGTGTGVSGIVGE